MGGAGGGEAVVRAAREAVPRASQVALSVRWRFGIVSCVRVRVRLRGALPLDEKCSGQVNEGVNRTEKAGY